MLRYAVLLDAGFVKRKLKPIPPADRLAAADFATLVSAIRAHDCLKDHRLHRIYFYDAEPLDRSIEHPVTKEIIDYKATATYVENTAILRDVGALRNVALRKGELSHDGWTPKWWALLKAGKYDKATDTLSLKSTDLKPIIRQKGVDMRIGLDIAALTLKKHVEIVVLVTADSDFVPAMKFARREGVQLYLFSLGHGMKDEMTPNADVLIDATAKELIDQAGLVAAP